MLDALKRGITITRSSLFSPSGRHANHIRLSACHHFSDHHVHALLTQVELPRRQIGGRPSVNGRSEALTINPSLFRRRQAMERSRITKALVFCAVSV